MSEAEEARRFYDRYVEEHVPYHRSPRGLKAAVLCHLPYWSYREWRFWRENVPLGCRLLDLGAARGREIFREQAAWAIGVDLAHAALADSLAEYDAAIEASLGRLPFADSTFSCVVSSHVLGHIPFADKPAVAAEVARVLQPGGRTVHVIEVDGEHPLAELAKKSPALYQRRLIEPDGHVGLDEPARAVARFEQAGLRLVEVTPWENGPLHPRLAVKWFDNEYRRTERRLDRLVRRSAAILRSPWRLALNEALLGTYSRWIGPRRGLDRALFLAAVFEKPRP